MKNRLIKILTISLLISTTIIGCGNAGIASNGDGMSNIAANILSAHNDAIASYEAEDGKLLGGAVVSTDGSDFSGNGYVSNLANDGDGVEISIEVPETGFYDLEFISKAPDYKENFVKVDGQAVSNLVSDSKEFASSYSNRVYLEAGEHKVEITKYWGWAEIDSIKVSHSTDITDDLYKVSPKLVNPNASDNAKRVMSFLTDIYGKNILSGQNCMEGRYGKEMAVLKQVTGKTPAVLGLDFIEQSPSRVENGSSSNVVDRAIQFWEDGGLVTFCWHWNAPSKYITGTWYSAFYKEHTNIDLDKIMNGQDEEGYELLCSDMDAIAQELLKLKEADVPILFRPLHEASGGWFWWGDCEADSYKKLYTLMFDKFVNEYELNNLIWVWNGQDMEWYPGDEYVDIVGIDIYPGEHVYTSQIDKFLITGAAPASNKIIALTENGCIPDPDQCMRDGAMWSFFCTWNGEFVVKNSKIYQYSDQYTEEDKVIEFFNNDIVISLEDLPDLHNYEIKKK